jgi:hypothetical protein
VGAKNVNLVRAYSFRILPTYQPFNAVGVREATWLHPAVPVNTDKHDYRTSAHNRSTSAASGSFQSLLECSIDGERWWYQRPR